jgi:membrane-bound serine protease (ClpP class)
MRFKHIVLVAVSLWVIASGSGNSGFAQTPAGGGVAVLRIDDAITPAMSDYITKGIDTAAAAGAELIVIEMDTPGGLVTSMQDIIQSILASPVPVATFVYPQGAQAASAGTYIVYASHVAAMAPATRIGAATPVDIGGASPLPRGGNPLDNLDQDDESSADDQGSGATPDADRSRDAFPVPATAEERKAINDAVAYIRSLAELRGRNADWAESAVRGAEALTAAEAARMGVVDLIASDLSELLNALDGRSIDGTRLELPANVAITEIEPDWRTRLLGVISHPTVAYMLMLIGIYGLIFEGYNPGAILPGVVGGISLILALFAFQVLPINYAGLALIVLGVILISAEFFVPSFGALGFGGIAAFVFGSVILIDTDVPGFEVATSMIAGIAFSGALALAGTIWLATRSRQRQVVSGVEEMTGMLAEALEDFEDVGPVWIHGERWNARSSIPVKKGQQLRVQAVTGLLLHVEPATRQQQ